MSTQNVFSGSVVSAGQGSIGFLATPTALADANASLTAAQILSGLLTITPTADRTLTLPTAVLLAAAVKSPLVIGSTIEFTVVNNAAAGATNAILALGAGIVVPSVAQRTVAGSFAAGAAAGSNSGSGTFILQCTINTAGAETFTMYRKS